MAPSTGGFVSIVPHCIGVRFVQLLRSIVSECFVTLRLNVVTEYCKICTLPLNIVAFKRSIMTEYCDRRFLLCISMLLGCQRGLA